MSEQIGGYCEPNDVTERIEARGAFKRDHERIMRDLYGMNGSGRGIVDFVTSLRANMKLLIILVTVSGILSTIGMFVLGSLEYSHAKNTTDSQPVVIYGEHVPAQTPSNK